MGSALRNASLGLIRPTTFILRGLSFHTMPIDERDKGLTGSTSSLAVALSDPVAINPLVLA